jgi:protein-disulfide isomerase
VPTLEQVLEKYPRQVKVVFKHYPLRKHAWAFPAARAATAAGNHGKFWEFHDLLFKSYNKLSDSKIEEIAISLGLDSRELKEEMKAPKIADRINADLRNGREAGVRGTPTVFIDGVLLRSKSIRGFERGIKAALRQHQNRANK